MMTKNDVIRELNKPADWHERRRKYIGGSDAKAIMSGMDDIVYELWLQKTGRAESENLDDVLPVQMGSWTEALNLYWFERKSGMTVSREGAHVVSQECPFMACTLDGFIASENAVVECKHCSGREPFEVIVERYAPQLTHEMIVTGASTAYLSVFLGSGDWRCQSVPLDPFYAASLIEAEAAFWQAVTTDTPPCAAPAIAAPMPEKLREVEMSSNAWIANAEDWKTYRKPAKLFETAKKELVALVERDVGRAYGGGIQIKRSRSGALTISEV